MNQLKHFNNDKLYIFNGETFIEINKYLPKEDITDDEKNKNDPDLSIYLSRDQLHAHLSQFPHYK